MFIKIPPNIEESPPAFRLGKLTAHRNRGRILEKTSFSARHYVRAMIVTESHSLQVYLGEDFVQSYEYRMPTTFSS